MEGSYTVEAAFVVPVILGIIFAYILFVMIERDKVILQGETEKYMIEQIEESRVRTDAEWKEELQEKLWLLKLKKIARKERPDSFQIKLVAAVEISVPAVHIFYSGKRQVTVTKKLIAATPEDTLRWKRISPAEQ